MKIFLARLPVGLTCCCCIDRSKLAACCAATYTQIVLQHDLFGLVFKRYSMDSFDSTKNDSSDVMSRTRSFNIHSSMRIRVGGRKRQQEKRSTKQAKPPIGGRQGWLPTYLSTYLENLQRSKQASKQASKQKYIIVD